MRFLINRKNKLLPEYFNIVYNMVYNKQATYILRRIKLLSCKHYHSIAYLIYGTPKILNNCFSMITNLQIQTHSFTDYSYYVKICYYNSECYITTVIYVTCSKLQQFTNNKCNIMLSYFLIIIYFTYKSVITSLFFSFL